MSIGRVYSVIPTPVPSPSPTPTPTPSPTTISPDPELTFKPPVEPASDSTIEDTRLIVDIEGQTGSATVDASGILSGTIGVLPYRCSMDSTGR
jgi:hypothetical protein